jgi:hypothetical protein
MLLLVAIVTVLVIAFLASTAAWVIAAHLNAGLRGFSPAPAGRAENRVSSSRIVLPTPGD